MDSGAGAEARAEAERHLQLAKEQMEEYRRLTSQGTPDLLLAMIAGLLTFVGAMVLLAGLWFLLPFIYPISLYILVAIVLVVGLYSLAQR